MARRPVEKVRLDQQNEAELNKPIACSPSIMLDEDLGDVVPDTNGRGR
jgi:hypothetical protein